MSASETFSCLRILIDRSNNMVPMELNQAIFKETVKSGIVLVDFWAPWCGPCRAFAPIFEKAAEENPDIRFGKLNTEEEPDLAIEYGIQAIPTLMAFRDGYVVFEQAGAMPGYALRKLIEQIKSLDMDKVRNEVKVHAAAS
jgi:thioredoxin 1